MIVHEKTSLNSVFPVVVRHHCNIICSGPFEADACKVVGGSDFLFSFDVFRCQN